MKKAIIIAVLFLLVFPTAAFMQYDPLVKDQWYLERINIFDAWDITRGDRDVVVAVLDTGVDISHPDLAGNIWINMDEWAGDFIDNDNNGYIDDINGYDFYYDYFEPTPALFFDYDDFVHHGTIVAGIIAAMQNGKGMEGVASNVRIMPIKVLDEFGYGDTHALIEAIDYAVDNGADIINFSLESFDDPVGIKEALERASEKNVITVAAAGNGWFGEGIDVEYDPIYPLCYDQDSPNVLVVGAASTDQDDWPSVFSNFGEECIDISAPGENILSTKIHQIASSLDDYYGDENDGTSFSSAIVSGVLALMKSVNRSLTNEQMLEAISQTADPVKLDFFMEEGDMGGGIINAHKALDYVLQKYGTSKSRLPWNIVVSQQSQGLGEITILDRALEKDKLIEAYDSEFTDGVSVEIFDINNDGNQEYIVAPAKGSPALFRILSFSEKLLVSRYIFEPEFTGGVNLGTITLENDGNTILACSGPGRKTEVALINEFGEKLSSFMPFDNDYGCTVDGGDIDGDGIEEIIVSSQKENIIKIYNQKPEMISKFEAYDNNFEGVNLDAVDINKDGTADILCGPKKGKPLVKIFDKDGNAIVSFQAYDFETEVKAKATDYDGEDGLEIITAPGLGAEANLRIFDLLGNVKAEKLIYPADFVGGVNIATGF